MPGTAPSILWVLPFLSVIAQFLLAANFFPDELEGYYFGMNVGEHFIDRFGVDGDFAVLAGERWGLFLGGFFGFH
jgi:hypothetical protein